MEPLDDIHSGITGRRRDRIDDTAGERRNDHTVPEQPPIADSNERGKHRRGNRDRDRTADDQSILTRQRPLNGGSKLTCIRRSEDDDDRCSDRDEQTTPNVTHRARRHDRVRRR